jgi:hypothetical protein
MERLISAPVHDFRVVCEAARQRERSFAEAVYPPRCRRRTGRLTFRAVGDESTELGVEASAYDGRVEDVRSLFELRSLVFPNATAIRDFCQGPLAEAFAESFSGSPEPPRPCDARALADQLDSVVGDQREAAERLAQLVAAGFERTRPAHPVSAIIAGPRGLGKATMARALLPSLEAIGCPGHSYLEIDPGTLAAETRAGAILGFPHAPRDQNQPPLVAALRQPRPVILVRGIERTNPFVMQHVVGPLLEDGSVIAPDGTRVCQPDAIVILTTAYLADKLADDLEGLSAIDRRARERLSRAHLRECEFLTDIADAVTAVVPFTPLEADAQSRAAERTVRVVADEYDVVLDKVDAVLCDSIVELTVEPVNLRSLLHTTRNLLGQVFANSRPLVDGVVDLQAGPPPRFKAASQDGEAP